MMVPKVYRATRSKSKTMHSSAAVAMVTPLMHALPKRSYSRHLHMMNSKCSVLAPVCAPGN